MTPKVVCKRDLIAERITITWSDRRIECGESDLERLTTAAKETCPAMGRGLFMLRSIPPYFTGRIAMQGDPDHRDSLDRFFSQHGTLTQDSTDGQEARSQARQDDRQASATQA